MREPDAAVFHRYAEYLWRRAGGIVLRWTVAGALLGAVLGAVMLTSWAHWPVPHREAYLLIVLGAVSGCVLGRSVGKTRALGLLLQAQLAQHQLEFERSTLARAAVATAEGEQERMRETPPAPALPYVPVGVPPVSAPTPAEPELESESESGVPEGEVYGWAAIEPVGS